MPSWTLDLARMCPMPSPTAFVLMPFDEAFDGVYENLIGPPLEKLDTPWRAPTPHSISRMS